MSLLILIFSVLVPSLPILSPGHAYIIIIIIIIDLFSSPVPSKARHG